MTLFPDSSPQLLFLLEPVLRYSPVPAIMVPNVTKDHHQILQSKKISFIGFLWVHRRVWWHIVFVIDPWSTVCKVDHFQISPILIPILKSLGKMSRSSHARMRGWCTIGCHA